MIGGPGNLCCQGLLGKFILSLLGKLLSLSMVRLQMEHITADVIVVAGDSVVVDNILLRVAEDISIVLSRLQIPRFHLNLIFIR